MPNVVITGMAGFIGFHTAIQFSADWNVYGFDNYNEYYDSSLKLLGLYTYRQIMI